MQDLLSIIQQLTEDQRHAARQKADGDMIASLGPKPQREDYDSQTTGRYSNRLVLWTSIGLLVLALAAGNISLWRLYEAGQGHYHLTMDGVWRGRFVGVSTFLMAELMVVLSTMAWDVVFDEDSKVKYLLGVPILLGSGIAIVGNWTVTQPHTAFGWLDTLSPPVAFAVIGLIGKNLILMASEKSHAADLTYEQAKAEYDKRAAKPRKVQGWLSAYMRRLKEQIRIINSRGRGKQERSTLMASLSTSDWVLLVQRELDEDRIWEQAAANPTSPAKVSGQSQQPMGFSQTQQRLPQPSAQQSRRR